MGCKPENLIRMSSLPRLATRERLFDRIGQFLRHAVILIVGLHGCGKTTPAAHYFCLPPSFVMLFDSFLKVFRRPLPIKSSRRNQIVPEGGALFWSSNEGPSFRSRLFQTNVAIILVTE